MEKSPHMAYQSLVKMSVVLKTVVLVEIIVERYIGTRKGGLEVVFDRTQLEKKR